MLDAVLAALVEDVKLSFSQRVVISFALMGDERFTLDTGSSPPVREGWTPNANVSILSDRRTLTDWLAGTFDPAKPADEHVLIWGGDVRAWNVLIAAFNNSQSLLDLRVGNSAGSHS